MHFIRCIPDCLMIYEAHFLKSEWNYKKSTFVVKYVIIPANACSSHNTITLAVGRRIVMTETFLGCVNENV